MCGRKLRQTKKKCCREEHPFRVVKHEVKRDEVFQPALHVLALCFYQPVVDALQSFIVVKQNVNVIYPRIKIEPPQRKTFSVFLTHAASFEIKKSLMSFGIESSTFDANKRSRTESPGLFFKRQTFRGKRHRKAKRDANHRRHSIPNQAKKAKSGRAK